MKMNTHGNMFHIYIGWLSSAPATQLAQWGWGPPGGPSKWTTHKPLLNFLWGPPLYSSDAVHRWTDCTPIRIDCTPLNL